MLLCGGLVACSDTANQPTHEPEVRATFDIDPSQQRHCITYVVLPASRASIDVRFDASASRAKNGNITTYDWNILSYDLSYDDWRIQEPIVQGTAEGRTLVWTFSQQDVFPVVFTVLLTATDDLGNTNQFDRSVVVTTTPPPSTPTRPCRPDY